MITIQDLYNIVGNKIANEAQKTLIRNNFPPQIAEQMFQRVTFLYCLSFTEMVFHANEL